MAATISRLQSDSALESNASDVVAVILADGTIAEPWVGAGAVIPLRRPARLARGSISGLDWILWWERRSFR